MNKAPSINFFTASVVFIAADPELPVGNDCPLLGLTEFVDLIGEKHGLVYFPLCCSLDLVEPGVPLVARLEQGRGINGSSGQAPREVDSARIGRIYHSPVDGLLARFPG
jgi:hypothetical protein